jgi:glucose/arabinose dehydrogenase
MQQRAERRDRLSARYFVSRAPGVREPPWYACIGIRIKPMRLGPRITAAIHRTRSIMSVQAYGSVAIVQPIGTWCSAVRWRAWSAQNGVRYGLFGTIEHRANSNHNGGLLRFGPDGMPRLGVGAGGGAGNVPNNAQNTDIVLGRLLRINVAWLPHTIPAGDPFGAQAGADGIWAYGLRNPRRYAFDVPMDGSAPKLYIADVGQGAREVVDVVDASAAGRNYG